MADPPTGDGEDEREVAVPPEVKHDPTGLDLARRVAAQLRGTAGRVVSGPARKQRRYNGSTGRDGRSK